MILFAPAGCDSPWRWCHCVDGRVVHSGQGRDAAVEGKRILVVPGWSVAARRVHPQGTGRARQTDALFLAEETVAGDIDDFHAVVHPETDDSSVVWLIDPARLAGWIADASQDGSAPDAAIPDFMCLPDSDGVSVYRSPDTLILRRGMAGVWVDRRLGLDEASVMAEAGAGDRVARSVFADISDPDMLCRSMAVVALGHGVSLLSGRFAPPGRWRAARRLWTTGAVLAAASIFIGVALVYVEAERFRDAAERYRVRTDHILTEAFGEGFVVQTQDPWSLVRRMREAGRNDFLVLSGILARALEAAPGIGVQSVGFDATTARMTVEIRFDSFRAVGILGQRVRAAGALLTEGASRQDGDSRLGEISLVLGR